MKPEYYIFVVVGQVSEGGRGFRTPREVLETRIRAQSWPLGGRTPHKRNLKMGDRVLFYAAGRGVERHHILGEAVLTGALAELRSIPNSDENWLGAVRPTRLSVPIGNAELFRLPVPVKPLLPRLVLVGNKVKWGTYFRGGIVKICKEDFLTLRGSATSARR